MRSRFKIALPGLLALMAIGCGRNEQSTVPAVPSNAAASGSPSASSGAPASETDASLIRQAVEDHVRTDRGINMSAMDMSIDSVSVAGEQAQANATFRVKQGGATMAMVYSLERHGNGWLVTKSQPAGGQFVHPPMDKTHTGTPPNGSAPAMPDMQSFFKSHPAPNRN